MLTCCVPADLAQRRSIGVAIPACRCCCLPLPLPAGKTTLMDVVLGRKTQGLIRGDILVNGHPKAQSTWSRVCGYVEQQVWRGRREQGLAAVTGVCRSSCWVS